MITNLFSIFDPAAPNFLSANWLSIFIFVFLFPFLSWVLPHRVKLMINFVTRYIFNEFSPLIKRSPFILLVPVALFVFIIFNNLIGLLSYVFTGSTQLVFTIALALPVWLSLIIYGWSNNTSNLLVHLIPQRTPTPLIPFMVLIETIRNLIRPVTLAVRLTANIVAGHLLVVLLNSADPVNPLGLTPLLFLAKSALLILEVAVAFIQAYVFRVLTTLYVAEFTN